MSRFGIGLSGRMRKGAWAKFSSPRTRSSSGRSLSRRYEESTAAISIRRERFLIEAKITGRLEHPGVVPVYGMGTDADGRAFYAMRFVKGETLRQAISRFHAGPAPDYSGLEFRLLLNRFVDVCNTVAYAHEQGVLHRDLKPSNIMLGDFGETLVVDWGIAKHMGTPETTESQELER